MPGKRVASEASGDKCPKQRKPLYAKISETKELHASEILTDSWMQKLPEPTG